MALLLCHVRSSIDDSRVLVQWAELLLLKEVGDLGPGTPALALTAMDVHPFCLMPSIK